jgi:hypothetical protein
MLLYCFFIAFNFTQSELLLLVFILDDAHSILLKASVSLLHQQDDQVPLTTEEHNAGDDCVLVQGK